MEISFRKLADLDDAFEAEESERVRKNYVTVQGLENYTDEVRRTLRKMYENGEVGSFPIKSLDGDITWVMDLRLKDGFPSPTALDAHRSGDLPAYEDTNGLKVYYENGIRTKQVGSDGSVRRFNENGLYHNQFGPAIITSSGDEEYWFNGNHLSYEDWKQRVDTSS